MLTLLNGWLFPRILGWRRRHVVPLFYVAVGFWSDQNSPKRHYDFAVLLPRCSTITLSLWLSFSTFSRTFRTMDSSPIVRFTVAGLRSEILSHRSVMDFHPAGCKRLHNRYITPIMCPHYYMSHQNNMTDKLHKALETNSLTFDEKFCSTNTVAGLEFGHTTNNIFECNHLK